ncbi:MAG: hypothetical protein HY735_23845 [Verrucomicrobia bacterium]|nr:hypothetical protein [Verrucomicrobiota bacterium]
MSLASMSPFWDRFPEVAARETRTIILPYPQGGLPAGSYGFLELFCTDPKCDCRRVLLQVRSEDKPDTVLATINYGWESVAFYAQWLHGDHEGAREIKNASLDPLNPQSKNAPSFLRLFQTVVLQDKAYIKRLKRHYTIFKQHLPLAGGWSGAPPATAPNSP